MKRDWIDAKFTVVSPPRRRWRLYFDWRVLLAVVALSAAAAMRYLGP